MLHAPLVISTAKLDIGSLLTSNPSPPRQNPTPTTRPPPFSRSTSVPSSTVQFPIVASPSTSSASHYSTSTAPPQGYSQIQTAPLGGRQPASGASSKRGPPINPDPLVSPDQKRQKKWTARENALLVSLRGANVKWGDISKQIPGRSNTSCRLRYQNYVEKDTAWTDEKKDKLARLYERYVSILPRSRLAFIVLPSVIFSHILLPHINRIILSKPKLTLPPTALNRTSGAA